MSNGMISKEEFKELPTDNKLGIMYDCLISVDRRLQKLESRKWIHNGFAATGGIMGGAATLATYLQFFH